MAVGVNPLDRCCGLIANYSSPADANKGRGRKHISVEDAFVLCRWVNGAGNIRFSDSLAGGAMMDLGCYGCHFSRNLVRAAGARGEPVVTSAAAKLRPG